MSRKKPERSAKSYHHGRLRDQLIEEGVQCVREAGFESVSLRELARRAGVSPNAPYRHFRDRQDLMAALAAKGFELLADGFRDAGLVPLGQAYLDFAIREPQLFRLMFNPDFCDEERYPELSTEGGRAYRLLVEQVSCRLPEASPQEVAHAAHVAWALVHGLSELVNSGWIPSDRDFSADFHALLRLASSP